MTVDVSILFGSDGVCVCFSVYTRLFYVPKSLFEREKACIGELFPKIASTNRPHAVQNGFQVLSKCVRMGRKLRD